MKIPLVGFALRGSLLSLLPLPSAGLRELPAVVRDETAE
jgi:hypothetical protein